MMGVGAKRALGLYRSCAPRQSLSYPLHALPGFCSPPPRKFRSRFPTSQDRISYPLSFSWHANFLDELLYLERGWFGKRSHRPSNEEIQCHADRADAFG